MDDVDSITHESSIDGRRARRSGGKHRRKHGKTALRLSVACVVLGIGCVSWALVNIGAQSVQSADANVRASANVQSPASPESLPAEQFRSPGDDFAPKGTEHPSSADGPDKAVYTKRPVGGDRIGTLSIPVLEQRLPIIEGTSDDDLKKGVGHFTQSVLPGEVDNCVLSGHRDTVFARLGTLKVGDRLITKTSAGTFTYKIRRIRIVHKDDRTVIVPTDNAVLTVTTCYPFNFVGSAPDRYVLIADLVTSK